MSKRLLDFCDSCFYRDYLSDYEPCSNCFKDRAKTGKYTHYVNAIWEQEEGEEMKRCPNCNGSIIRMGHKEKPFFCKSCNEWFSDKDVTPKQTNADRIRMMTDEELAETFTCIDMICCPVKGASCSEEPSCKNCFMRWLKQEVSND